MGAGRGTSALCPSTAGTRERLSILVLVWLASFSFSLSSSSFATSSEILVHVSSPGKQASIYIDFEVSSNLMLLLSPGPSFFLRRCPYAERVLNCPVNWSGISRRTPGGSA